MAKSTKTSPASEKTVRNSRKKPTDLIKEVRKRNGKLVPFDIDRIATAVYKAMIAAGEGSDVEASMIANKVFGDLVKTKKRHKDFVPTVEGIQDTVENELIDSDYRATAKAYILYREERRKIREEEGIEVPEKVKELIRESKKYFRNELSEFVYYRTYSRWLEEEGRRETWIETVDRYIAFMKENIGNKLTEKEYKEIRQYILEQKAMPSCGFCSLRDPLHARQTCVHIIVRLLHPRRSPILPR